MKNTHKLYAFSFFWMFLVIMPVIVPYFLQLGLTMHQVFQLVSIFGITVVAFELPTGYICDLFGRKNVILLGSFLTGVAFTLLIFTKTFASLCVYEVIQGISLSLVSGADIAMLYDSVDKSERKHGTHSLANMQLSTTAGESVASILGGLLVVYSYQHVLVLNAITSWVPFVIALTLKEQPYQKLEGKSHVKNFKKVFRHIFLSHDRILTLTSINLVFWGLSSFIAVWIFQKYWQDGQIPLHYFGFIWAGYNLSVGIVGKQVHRLEHKFGPIPLLIFVGLAPIVGYIGMGLTAGSIGLVLGFLFYLSRGINQILLKDSLNWRVPSSFRATANSLQSFFFRLGFAIVGPAVGFSIDHFSMKATLLFALLPLIGEIRKSCLDYIPDS
jgi:MFS family permease